MKTLSFKLPEPLYRKLALAVKHRHVQKSVIVREALESYLDQSNGPPRGSFLEEMRHLNGCVKDAPADLSSLQRFRIDPAR